MRRSGAKKTLRGGVVLTAGKLGAYGCAFARNAIIARLLAPDDVGLSLLLIAVITLFEFSGRLGLGTQVIQAPNGAGRRFIGSAQTFQLITGVAAAIMLAAFASPLAEFLKVGDAAWAFVLLAGVPLVRAFENLKYLRLQRHLRFGAAAIYEFLPQVITLTLVWPVAKWLGDWRTVLFLIGVRTVLGVIITNVVAGSLPTFSWSRTKMCQLWNFGWPLLATSGLLFLIQQADQFTLGATLTLTEVARYGLALSIVMVPWMIIAEACKQIMLPRLSRAARSGEGFVSEVVASAELSAFFGALGLIPLIAAGSWLMEIVFGSDYSGNGPVIALLGAAMLVRFIRFVPAVAAMAQGKTGLQLRTNLVRGISFPVSAVLLVAGFPVEAVAVSALMSEIAAAIYSWGALAKMFPSVRGAWKCGAVVSITSLIVAAIAYAVTTAFGSGMGVSIVVMFAIEGLVVLGGILFFQEIIASVVTLPPFLTRLRLRGRT